MPWKFSDWWAKNKRSKNKERREKYAADPEHREAVREQARKNYRVRRRRMTPIDRRTIRAADGTRFWSIGRVARLIGRPIPTIRSYHQAGVIPEPLARDERNWRLYTSNQAMLMRQAFKALDDPNDTSVQSLADVKALVTPRWRD